MAVAGTRAPFVYGDPGEPVCEPHSGQAGPYARVNGTFGGGTGYTDSGLANGTTYWYRITAVDNSGNESAPSAAVCATPAAVVAPSSHSISPTSVRGGVTAAGTVTLTAPAPAGGVQVLLSSSQPNTASVPESVVVPSGSSSASFAIATTRPKRKITVTISATYGAITRPLR